MCLNDTINLRPLTPHIMPRYTHKMAIVSRLQVLWRHVTSPHALHVVFSDKWNGYDDDDDDDDDG